MSRRRRWRAALLRYPVAGLSLGAVLWAGCAGDGPSGTPGAVPTPTPTPSASPSYEQVQAQVFNPNCLSAGCHNASGQAAGLVLDAAVSYGDLVNVTPTNLAAAAQGLVRVRPGNLEQSYLYQKLLGPAPQLGSRMPLGEPPLSEADIELVRTWILDGAPGPIVVPAR